MVFLIIGIVVGPLIISLYARGRFQSVYDETRKVKCRPNLTGAGVARKILEARGIDDVQIVEHWGLFPDYYDPDKKRLALSRQHFRGSNAAAYGVAAHEAGRALQAHARYPPLKLRILAIKVSQYFSPLIFIVPAILLVTRILAPRVAVIVMFGSWALVLGFNLITMPVEVDATERAKEVLRKLKIFQSRKEQSATFKMAKAAGLMYVSGFLNTVRWLISSMIPRRKSKD